MVYEELVFALCRSVAATGGRGSGEGHQTHSKLHHERHTDEERWFPPVVQRSNCWRLREYTMHVGGWGEGGGNILNTVEVSMCWEGAPDVRVMVLAHQDVGVFMRCLILAC
jgi:hypothetical protein